MEAVAEEAKGGDFAQGLFDALGPEEVPPAFRRILGS